MRHRTLPHAGPTIGPANLTASRDHSRDWDACAGVQSGGGSRQDERLRFGGAFSLTAALPGSDAGIAGDASALACCRQPPPGRTMSLTRRRFLASSGLAAAGLLAACKGQGGKDARPPNILCFLSDDQRNDTLGCTGDRLVRTPNIDALARRGSLFRNAFVTTAICPSSRASILTGVTETRHHFTFHTPPLSRALCDTSYPALFHGAGYRTGMIGKFGVQMAQDAQTTLFDVFEDRDRPYDKVLPDGRHRHVDEINTTRRSPSCMAAAVINPSCWPSISVPPMPRTRTGCGNTIRSRGPRTCMTGQCFPRRRRATPSTSQASRTF
ncbi:hypothetical protein BH11PSE14_BH11PSE14_09080 [soil metagenome]